MPTKLSEAELLRYRSTIYGVAAHVGHVPKMHLGKSVTTCDQLQQLGKAESMASTMLTAAWESRLLLGPVVCTEHLVFITKLPCLPTVRQQPDSELSQCICCT